MRRKGQGLGFQTSQDGSNAGEEVENDVDSDGAAAQGVGLNSKSKIIKKSFVVNRGKRLSKNEKFDDSSDDDDDPRTFKRQQAVNEDSDSDAQLFNKNATKPKF